MLPFEPSNPSAIVQRVLSHVDQNGNVTTSTIDASGNIMQRDKLKSGDYFEKYIQSAEIRKSNYIKKIEGLDDPKQGFINSSITLDLFTRNILIAKYSEGTEIEVLIKDYVESISWLSFCYNSTSFYVQMLWMISIGILLDISKEEFDKLLKLVYEDNPNDYLIDFLLKSKKIWEQSHTDFKFPQPYQFLKEVISLANDNRKEQAILKLKEYLDKEWYKGHSDSGWYDNHKSKHNTYNGYWSWESGALVKILGLDDTILKDQQYYPYDMVHWKY